MINLFVVQNQEPFSTLFLYHSFIKINASFYTNHTYNKTVFYNFITSCIVEWDAIPLLFSKCLLLFYKSL